jgi:hypothetical protein
MREALQKINGVRAKFTGRFIRYGTRRTYTGQRDKTLLLREIKDEMGNLRTDHLWFRNIKAFQYLGELQGGEIIEFYARVIPYKKYYRGLDSFERVPEIDYKLSHPTRVKIFSTTNRKSGDQLELNFGG